MMGHVSMLCTAISEEWVPPQNSLHMPLILYGDQTNVLLAKGSASVGLSSAG